MEDGCQRVGTGGIVVNTRYADVIREHLARAFERGAERLARAVGASSDRGGLAFPAFGEACRVRPGGVEIGGRTETGPRGVVVSLYLRHAAEEETVEAPFRAYREWPDSGPYVAAFAKNAELPLVARVDRIEAERQRVLEAFAGRVPEAMPGDFSLLLAPLPKVRLCYVFYRSDEEFPASATCLFSANANRFLPVDGLADLAEYTSRRILDLIEPGG
jgi:hypothetical protein